MYIYIYIYIYIFLNIEVDQPQKNELFEHIHLLLIFYLCKDIQACCIRMFLCYTLGNVKSSIFKRD